MGLLSVLAACAPNNAELTEGSYIAFLSDGTSLSLAKEKVDPADYATTYNVDCREFETPEDEAALRLPDALKICGPNVWPPDYEQWAVQAGFRVVEEDLDPWRGEALITSEGDLQLSFHHHVPGGADFRIIFTVDPDFGPTTCDLGDGEQTGALPRVPLDGNWVEEWSTELDKIASLDDAARAPYSHMEEFLDGGRLYFLNAFSYQLNPSEPDGRFWDLPETWIAGAAQGKFVEEDVFHRTARFGEPSIYNLIEVGSSSSVGSVNPADLWYCDLEEGADPLAANCAGGKFATMEELDAHVREVGTGIQDELVQLMSPDKDAEPVFTYAPIEHTNFWRVPDGRPPGLDGWSELHYNYVVFSGDSDLSVGGQAAGAFSLVLDSGNSSTRVFVKGKFSIDKIKKDRWTTDNLSEDKLIENGVELCNAASEEEADPSGAAE
ncbi:MAG: hypothetical protein ABMB14_20365 [Myxococcota bacterium]